MRILNIFQFSLCFFLIINLWQCTNNPFSNEEGISNNTIRGTVELSDGASPKDVHVWFEPFGISARTDENGSFELTLPPHSEQGGGGVNGIFNLYFYVANYGLTSVEVILFNGTLKFPTEVFNRKGEIADNVRLVKILSIEASLSSSSFTENREDSIEVTLTAQATVDPIEVTAAFSNPLSQGDPQFIVGFIRKANGDQNFCMSIYRENRQHRTAGFQIDKQQIELFPLVIYNKPGALSPGEYEFIPHLQVHQKNIPLGLTESLDNDAGNLCRGFFNIPLKVKNNRFRVLSGM